MWLTDEKAIRDFRSVCREQSMADRRTPNIENTINGVAIGRNESFIKVLVRKMPYPPSLRSVPAKIIEPAIGASTWALGNQR